MSKIKIEDFHIGFEYEELQPDSERYFSKGLIWVKKTYNFNSPRLHKINELIKQGKVRHVKKACDKCGYKQFVYSKTQNKEMCLICWENEQNK